MLRSLLVVAVFALMSMRRALTRLTRRAFSAQPTRRAFSAQPARAATPFAYEPLFQAPTPGHPMRKLTSDYVSTATVNGRTILNVEPEALRLLASSAMVDIAHLLRPGHLQQLANILDDPEASANDRFVALELLKNANVAASKVLPGCQDTGTAIVMGKRGQYVWTDGADEEHLSKGVFDTYTGTHLRYSQVAPLDMFTEANTKCNLPAQVEIYATPGSEYGFHFMAKGGGSANKTFLFQQTKARNSSNDGAILRRAILPPRNSPTARRRHHRRRRCSTPSRSPSLWRRRSRRSARRRARRTTSRSSSAGSPPR